MISVRQALDSAWQHFQRGQWQQAEQLYLQVLEVDPGQVDALHLLAVIAGQTGRIGAAIEYLGAVLRVQPGLAAAHNNLGSAFAAQGKFPEAVASFQEAVRLQPDFVVAHNNLGNALREQGRLAEAVASLQQALRIQPDDAEAHNNLGLTFKEQGRLEEAVACCRRALDLKPDYAEAHNNLGIALNDQGKRDEAVACYRRAVDLKPEFPLAHYNLGNILRDEGKLDESIACYRRALELKPDLAEAHNNLGIALNDQGKLDDALACYRRALEPKPEFAEAHWNRSNLWLLCGNFSQGWPEYEWRWRRKDGRPRCFSQTLWDGQFLQGKTILLHAEQGLGDTIQFIRYTSLAARYQARVVVECQKPLLRLLTGCPGIDQLIGAGMELPEFDVHAPLMSLPLILKTTLENIPAVVPYIFPAPELVTQWRNRLSGIGGFKIGIGWQGNPGYRGDRFRSIPLRHFAALAEVSGVGLISLQKGAGREQLAEVRDACPIVDWADELDEQAGPFMDTAAAMKNLDLVITSDTALAHLAGAIGVPVWVALPLAPDWRWLLDRSDSPWYPSMRLFRQRRRGDWQGVFDDLRKALCARLQAPGTDSTP